MRNIFNNNNNVKINENVNFCEVLERLEHMPF